MQTVLDVITQIVFYGSSDAKFGLGLLMAICLIAVFLPIFLVLDWLHRRRVRMEMWQFRNRGKRSRFSR